MATYEHENGGALNDDQRGGHWHIFRTADDPEANGRKPQYGETRWTATLPLEDGSFLKIHMGKKGRDTLFGMLIADCADSNEPEPDQQEHRDG